jgi:hypothetical protein
MAQALHQPISYARSLGGGQALPCSFKGESWCLSRHSATQSVSDPLTPRRRAHCRSPTSLSPGFVQLVDTASFVAMRHGFARALAREKPPEGRPSSNHRNPAGCLPAEARCVISGVPLRLMLSGALAHPFLSQAPGVFEAPYWASVSGLARCPRGDDRNRTGVDGFAGRCVATPPRRQETPQAYWARHAVEGSVRAAVVRARARALPTVSTRAPVPPL